MRRSALLLVAGCSFTGHALPDGATTADVPTDDGAPTIDAPMMVDHTPPGGIAFPKIDLWYAAEDAMVDPNNEVQGWPDRGPHHLDLVTDATYAPAVWQPATAHSAATVKFSNNRLVNTAGLTDALTDVTLIAVVKDPTHANFDWVFYASGDSVNNRISISHGFNGATNWDFDLPSDHLTNTQNDGDPLIIAYVASTTQMSVGNHRLLYVNGKQVDQNGTFAQFSPIAGPIELGDHVGGDNGKNPYDGFLGELYLAEGVTTDPASFERLETYFALRYGISVAHDYVDSSGAVVFPGPNAAIGFTFRVVGMALDAAARLQLTAAATDDDVLRISASGALPADRSYFIAADNNGEPNSAGNRVWRIQHTWSSEVTLDFKAPNNPNTPQLLVSPDLGFGAPQMIPMAAAGGRVVAKVTGLPATCYVKLKAP